MELKKLLLTLGLLLFTVFVSYSYENVNAEKFKELMKNKDVIILDVRTPQEYEKDGHIKGANLIPVQVFQYIYLSGLRDKEVLVYCRSGRRSAEASKFLEQMGVKKVYNLQGGIKEWKAKGFPVEYGWK
ncbi:rhodanese-like domain-containing protein [Persephonella sp.]